MLRFFLEITDWLAPLFSFAGVSSFTGIVICGFVIWLGGPRAKMVAIVAAAVFLAFYIGNFIGDHNGADRIQTRWDDANEQMRIAAEKRDKDIAAKAAAAAKTSIAEIRSATNEREERIREYENELARKSTGACILTDADLARLQNLRDPRAKRQRYQ
jgi:hypothetical protein